jgi:hypothetical protein
MIKSIFGITEDGQQVELKFTKYLMITDNDSKLTLDTHLARSPDGDDLLLFVDTGPSVQDGGNENCRIAEEGHRHLQIIPGAMNMAFIKVVRKNAV